MTTERPHDGPNFEGLPLTRIKRGTGAAWTCRVCHENQNFDKVNGRCVSCGRNYWGEPGTVPSDKPHRPALRGD